MKLTDYALVFVVLVWCVFSNVSMKNHLMEQRVYSNSMSNNIMDNVVEGALVSATQFENYKPFINQEKVMSELLEFIKHYKNESDYYQEYLKECIKLVVIFYPDGYCLAGTDQSTALVNDFKWSEKKIFSQGKVTKKEEKQKELLEEIRKNYGIDLLVAGNDGDTLNNTIDEYSLLLVYETYPFHYMGREYKNLTFSGAKVNYDISFNKKAGD